MRARISNVKKIRGERISKFYVSKLEDENTANMYPKRLEERLKQSPCTGGETIQEEWDQCKNTIQQVFVNTFLLRFTPRMNDIFNCNWV